MSTGPTKEKVRVRAEGFGALRHLDVSTTKAGTFCRPDARRPRVVPPKPASAVSTARVSALLSWTAAPPRYHRLLRQQSTRCCSAPARSVLGRYRRTRKGRWCGTATTMEQPMLKRLHPRSVSVSRSSPVSRVCSLRPLTDRLCILLWRLEPLHPPSLI